VGWGGEGKGERQRRTDERTEKKKISVLHITRSRLILRK
jgi:hypothetical protein